MYIQIALVYRWRSQEGVTKFLKNQKEEKIQNTCMCREKSQEEHTLFRNFFINLESDFTFSILPYEF